MGLAKKGTRIITVDEKSYRWVVSFNKDSLRLIVESKDSPGQRLDAGFKYYNSYLYDQDKGCNLLTQRRSITPSLVKSVILLALEKGWKPTQRGLGNFSLWLDEEFPITESSEALGVSLEDIAKEIVGELRCKISEDINWRHKLFYAPVGKRFEISYDNKYGLKFAAFLNGHTDSTFWFIGIESIDFPHIVLYSSNGVL